MLTLNMLTVILNEGSDAYCKDAVNMIRKLKFRRNKRFLIVLLFLSICTSCSLIEKVEQSTNAIDENRQAVEASTDAIAANKAKVEESNAAISANKTAVKTSSLSILENQKIIENNNKTIAENRDVVEKANKAIRANEEIIMRSTMAIQQNIAAVEQSSLMIKKNAEAVSEATNLLSQIKLSPFVVGLISLMMLIALFIIPLLLVLFMWRIQQDIHLLLQKRG